MLYSKQLLVESAHIKNDLMDSIHETKKLSGVLLLIEIVSPQILQNSSFIIFLWKSCKFENSKNILFSDLFIWNRDHGTYHRSWKQRLTVVEPCICTFRWYGRVLRLYLESEIFNHVKRTFPKSGWVYVYYFKSRALLHTDFCIFLKQATFMASRYLHLYTYLQKHLVEIYFWKAKFYSKKLKLFVYKAALM